MGRGKISDLRKQSCKERREVIVVVTVTLEEEEKRDIMGLRDHGPNASELLMRDLVKLRKK